MQGSTNVRQTPGRRAGRGGSSVLLAVLLAVLAMLLLSLFAILEGGKSAQAIVGGKDVKPDDKYPFMALIEAHAPAYGDKVQGCNGTLIDNDSVLTAAHCFEGMDLKQLNKDPKVFVKVLVQGQVRTVCDIQVHKSYDLNGGQGQLYDVAVLTLEPPIQNPQPIRLASVKQKNTLEEPGRKARVVGSGKEAQVRISSDKVAANYWSGYDPDLHISTYNKKKYVEQGDSGGPLLVKKCKKGKGTGKIKCRYIQIGIVANGQSGTRWFACDLAQKKCPDVYTDVNNPSIRDFITTAKKASCPKDATKPPNQGGGNQGGSGSQGGDTTGGSGSTTGGDTTGADTTGSGSSTGADTTGGSGSSTGADTTGGGTTGADTTGGSTTDPGSTTGGVG
jgi:secreted trypsin-like serine protease